MIVTSLYRRRLVRRRSSIGAGGFASRRQPAIESDLGGWRTVTKAKAKAKEIHGVARAGGRTAAEAETPPAAAGTPAAGQGEAAATRSSGVDRERLAAAGYLDADSGRPLLRAQFAPIATPLVTQAFAPDVRRRDRVILVSSAGAGEGKTFAAINLALTLSHEGREVLLIDADPQTAGATRRLGLASEPGLSDGLGDGLTLDQLIQPTGLDHLTFLAPGRAPATMTGLLASPRMARLTRELLARSPDGLIVIDGPALLSGTEAAALAMYAGQVVLVVAAGRTTAAAIEQSLGRLGEQAHRWLVFADTPVPADRRPGARTKAVAR